MSDLLPDTDGQLALLKQFLRIPSVSTLPEHGDDMIRAADWVAARLVEAGLRDVETVREGQGHPLVYGERCDTPGAPTVLLYGHYDVQPPDPVDEWETPPFDPVVRNGAVYARGASDDKGQLAAQLFGLRTAARNWGDGPWPVNVRVLVEGEEECGGSAIESWLDKNAHRIPTDAVIVSDTHFIRPGQPSIDYSLRGILYVEIICEGPSGDLHSGIYGGAVLNPFSVLCSLVAGMIDTETGRVRIPGFYDRVAEITELDQALAREVPFDDEAFLRNAGVSTAWGEEGYSIYDRISARPTLDVHGVAGGFQGAGAKTVLPARAAAKISMRLVPDQRPDEIMAALEEFVTRRTPRGVRSSVKKLHASPGIRMDPSSVFHQTAARALEEAFGRKTVFIRSGGSIPITRVFQERLGAEVVFMGLGLPDDGPHGPNEKFSLDHLKRGAEAARRFYELLGAGGRPAGRR